MPNPICPEKAIWPQRTQRAQRKQNQKTNAGLCRQSSALNLRSLFGQLFSDQVPSPQPSPRLGGARESAAAPIKPASHRTRDRRSFAKTLGAFPPLPEGEGRGEGEARPFPTRPQNKSKRPRTKIWRRDRRCFRQSLPARPGCCATNPSGHNPGSGWK